MSSQTAPGATDWFSMEPMPLDYQSVVNSLLETNRLFSPKFFYFKPMGYFYLSPNE